jgi:R3H domain
MDNRQIREQIHNFLKNDGQEVYTFLPPLELSTRKLIHLICDELKIISESVGSGNERMIIIRKKLTDINSENEITDEDRKLFIRDFNLPIPVYRQPYFEYFVELYKDIYNSQKKYQMLKNTIATLKNENQNFKQYSYELLNKIVNTIKNLPQYEEFIKNNFKEYSHDFSEMLSGPNIYVNNDHRWPKYYISLDIIKANFNSTRFYSPELVLNYTTWEDFIKSFTSIPYFIESKQFRQIVFGNLNPRRSAFIQKSIVYELYQKIEAGKSFNIKRVSTDEIIISTNKENYIHDYQKLQEIVNTLSEKTKNVWKIVCFLIHPIGKSKAFIRKNIIDITKSIEDQTNMRVEIKNIEKDFHAQVYKYYMNLEMQDQDFKAMKDDYIITYEDKYMI